MKIEVIVKFLNEWKERVTEWAFEQKKILRDLNREICDAWNGGNKEKYEELRKEEKQLKSNLPKWVYQYDNNRIEKMLAHDVEAKYDILIARMNKVIGEVKDATYLEVGMNGELNGVIIGENGKARIETIGAGGYNIQCYHYRVLVHKIA